jgi:hypothetical protein
MAELNRPAEGANASPKKARLSVCDYIKPLEKIAPQGSKSRLRKRPANFPFRIGTSLL